MARYPERETSYYECTHILVTNINLLWTSRKRKTCKIIYSNKMLNDELKRCWTESRYLKDDYQKNNECNTNCRWKNEK